MFLKVTYFLLLTLSIAQICLGVFCFTYPSILDPIESICLLVLFVILSPLPLLSVFHNKSSTFPQLAGTRIPLLFLAATHNPDFPTILNHPVGMLLCLICSVSFEVIESVSIARELLEIKLTEIMRIIVNKVFFVMFCIKFVFVFI